MGTENREIIAKENGRIYDIYYGRNMKKRNEIIDLVSAYQYFTANQEYFEDRVKAKKEYDKYRSKGFIGLIVGGIAAAYDIVMFVPGIIIFCLIVVISAGWMYILRDIFEYGLQAVVESFAMYAKFAVIPVTIIEVIVFSVLTPVAIILLVKGNNKKKECRLKLGPAKEAYEKAVSKAEEVYRNCPFCPVSYEYAADPKQILLVIGILEANRANSVSEAINIVEQEKAMRRMQQEHERVMRSVGNRISGAMIASSLIDGASTLGGALMISTSIALS